jgi:hypothetical protein
VENDDGFAPLCPGLEIQLFIQLFPNVNATPPKEPFRISPSRMSQMQQNG